MNNTINQNQIITTAPYNTLNLPEGKRPNFFNPVTISNAQYDVPNLILSHRVSLDTENNYYNPTQKMVNNNLKTNQSMYDNRGKYFDSYLFNQKFDEYIKQKTTERQLKEQVQLYDLDSIDNIQVQPYELPLNKLIINFKNIWFELFDDLLTGKDPSNLFTTTNFFYFGITLIVVFVLYIMLSYIFQ
jgi:hypothetical protein